jgi:hypothetical protein
MFLFFQFCDVTTLVIIPKEISHIWLLDSYEIRNLLKSIYILASCLNNV